MRTLILAAVAAFFVSPALAQTSNGKVTTAAPTYVNNTAAPLSLDTAGNLRVTTSGGGSVVVVGAVTPADAFANPTNAIAAYSLGGLWNGATWDRAPGNTLAAFVQGPIADDAGASTSRPVPVGGIYNTTLPTYTNLDRAQAQFDVRGNILAKMTAGSLAGADGFANVLGYVVNSTDGTGQRLLATAPVNFNGATWDLTRGVVNGTNSVGTGIVAAGMLAQYDDTAPVSVTENSFGNLRMSQDHVLYVSPAPTSSAGTAITPISSGSADDNLVLKASAGNLYSVYVTVGGTAGYLMIFNATSEPADGAVTPVHCIQAPVNSTVGVDYAGVPARFATGITAVFSTTGCFTKTTTPTVFFQGGVS